MSALKRVNPRGLRQGVPQGTRVIILYDKAAIDFTFWKRCRQECAVYFISRVKENMVFDCIRVANAVYDGAGEAATIEECYDCSARAAFQAVGVNSPTRLAGHSPSLGRTSLR